MSVTAVSIGIQPAGSFGGADVPGVGHTFINLQNSDGTITQLQAGPSLAPSPANGYSAGSLIQEPGYVGVNNGGLNIIVLTPPAGVSIADFGQSIYDAATAFNYNSAIGESQVPKVL